MHSRRGRTLLLVEVGLLAMLLFLYHWQLLSLRNDGVLHVLCDYSGLHFCLNILQRSCSSLPLKKPEPRRRERGGEDANV
jgi:hypothetical protein